MCCILDWKWLGIGESLIRMWWKSFYVWKNFIWINYTLKTPKCDMIMIFLLYTFSQSCQFFSHLFLFLFLLCLSLHIIRWNFSMRTEFWASISRCDIWFKCAIFYSRMEKRFFRPGQMAKPKPSHYSAHIITIFLSNKWTQKKEKHRHSAQ